MIIEIWFLRFIKKFFFLQDELKNFQQTGIVLQAYLRDCYEHFCDILELAKKRGMVMPIRLVKGAYWDAETVHADAHTYNAPQFLNKEETDLHFRQMVLKILEHGEHVQLCLAATTFLITHLQKSRESKFLKLLQSLNTSVCI